MHGILVVLLTIYLPHIRTENIYLNQGEEKLNSVFSGDNLTLLCPVSNLKDHIYWSYKGELQTRLSIDLKLKPAKFRFNVSYTNNLNQTIYLMIYNISSNEQHVYQCYYSSKNNTNVEYKYSIQLANIPNVFIKDKNETICCMVNGTNINSTNIIWEQRTLLNEHIRFVKSDQIKRSEMLTSSQQMSCLNINGILTYAREGRYICMAQISINGRKQTMNSTTSIEKRNTKDRPLCIQDKRIQRSILGSYISIVTNFYSKSEYYNISVRKGDGDLDLDTNLSVSNKNISVDIFNVTVIVSGYAIIINITEFSDEDIGNYTFEMHNEFGFAMCTVQLQPRGNKDHAGMDETKETENRATETKYLQWYMMACGSLIVIFVAMFALRSTFLKTVNACSKTKIWRPRFHKSTEKQATRIKRRAYSDQFMEVTLNQLNNGERILIIGQTNEMDASTETNI